MSEEKTKGFSFSRKHGGYFFMKKFCITFLLSGIIILSAIGFGTGILGSGSTANTNTEYLRIHIRANSNDGEDQAVKYMVRDAVVAVSYTHLRAGDSAKCGQYRPHLRRDGNAAAHGASARI